MKTIIKLYITFVIAGLIVFASCKKNDYSFGQIKTPANLTLTTTVVGATSSIPTGDGSGKVKISVRADNAITYKIYFGNSNGDSAMTPTGDTTFTYNTPDTNQYTIVVNAIGTGGAISTISKSVKVFTAFQIPASMVTALTNDASKVWVHAATLPGHFGVGPTSSFSPDWYSADGSRQDACADDDEITFTKLGANSISISVDNKGSSFIIGAATSDYGQSGGDGCYPITTGGTKTLTFSYASSGSSSSNSTGIQFSVPGNGIVNYGLGAKNYEILSLSNVLSIRCIGADGNAWYQKLQPK